MNLKYFITFTIILFIEVCIAFSHGFIRHTLGDYFVVILLYCFIKSFVKVSTKKVAAFVLAISFLIEFLQLLNIKKIYPEKYTQTFKIIFGTTFSFGDLIAYTLGILTILVIEKNIKYWYEEIR